MFDYKKFFSKKKTCPVQNETAVEQPYVIPPSVPQISKQMDTVYELDEVQQELFDAIENTSANFFVQGQAGTGKSTFVQYLKKHTSKEDCIACPTAIAALNIGGVTLHSLFRFPFSDFFIFEKLELAEKTKQILRKKDLLIIDEVSMVRPDMLNAIDMLAPRLPLGDCRCCSSARI